MSAIFQKYYFPVFIFIIIVTGYWDSPIRKVISLVFPLFIIGVFLIGKKFTSRTSTPVMLIGLYILICLISALFAYNLINSLFFFLRILIFFLLIAALYDWMNDYRKYILTILSIVISGIILSLSIVYSRFFGTVIVENEGAIRAGGIFSNVNSAGFVLFIAIIYAFLMYLEKDKKRYWLYIILFLTALVFTGSRASMLALAVSFLFYNLRFKLTKKIIIICVSSLLFTILGFFLFQDKILSALRLERGLSARQILYNIGLDIAADYPYLGIGLGNLKDVGPQYLVTYPIGEWQKNSILDIGIQSSHNVFIETAAEIGLIGAGVLILIIVNIGFRYYRQIKKVDPSNKNFYYLIWGLFMGILVRCLFESNGIINRGWITVDIFFWVTYVIFLRSKQFKIKYTQEISNN